jgi:hypothetical protein
LKKLNLFFIAILLICLTPNLLYAAGAYLVDDGGIDEPETLQVENWYSRSNTGENVYVTNPAYQVLPNLEVSMQETYSDMARSENSLWPQMKYQWFKQKNIFSSVVLGVNYSSTNRGIYGNYSYSATTFKLNETIDLHVYLGWQNWRHAFKNEKSIDFFNYGSGTEIHLNNKLSLTAEFFVPNGLRKNGDVRPASQFGSRYVVSKNVILDFIYGHNINGNAQNWFTVGLSLWF